MGVDLGTLQGSGPGGRIVREDVVAAGKSTSPKQEVVPQPAAPVAANRLPRKRLPLNRQPCPREIAGRGPRAEDKKILLSGMRKTIAARLFESKTTIPHFYLQAEIDAEPLTNLRSTTLMLRRNRPALANSLLTILSSKPLQ